VSKVDESAKGLTNSTVASLPKERQIDKSKLVDYLLHPVNSRGKLGLFSSYGFGQSNWEVLRDSLLEHAETHPVCEQIASRFGTKYIVNGVLNTPSERQPLPVMTAVWQQDAGAIGVRLITAYPT
jgi:hypothetical protein